MRVLFAQALDIFDGPNLESSRRSTIAARHPKPLMKKNKSASSANGGSLLKTGRHSALGLTLTHGKGRFRTYTLIPSTVLRPPSLPIGNCWYVCCHAVVLCAGACGEPLNVCKGRSIRVRLLCAAHVWALSTRVEACQSKTRKFIPHRFGCSNVSLQRTCHVECEHRRPHAQPVTVALAVVVQIVPVNVQCTHTMS